MSIGAQWPDVEWVCLFVMNGDLQKHMVFYYWQHRYELIEDEL